MHKRRWGDGVVEVYPRPEPQHGLWESVVSTEVDSLQNSTGRHPKALAENSSHDKMCLMNDFLKEPCSPEASQALGDTLMVKSPANKGALAKASNPGKDEPPVLAVVPQNRFPGSHQHHKPFSAPDSGAPRAPSFPALPRELLLPWDCPSPQSPAPPRLSLSQQEEKGKNNQREHLPSTS